jgi:hypothetical protein
MKRIAAIIALLFAATVARGDSIYDYQGNQLSGCSSCYLSGSVTLAGSPMDTNNVEASFVPVAYNFVVAGSIFTETNSTGDFSFRLQDGAIGLWDVHISNANGSLFSYSYDIAEATDSFALSNGATGGEEGNRGTWSGPVNTPEPGTLALLVVGLLGLLAVKPQ